MDAMTQYPGLKTKKLCRVTRTSRTTARVIASDHIAKVDWTKPAARGAKQLTVKTCGTSCKACKTPHLDVTVVDSQRRARYLRNAPAK